MSLVVRVIAPTGRDGELITGVLRANGLEAESVLPADEILERGEEDPIGPLFIAEEALTPAFVGRLGNVIGQQPAWSDLPIILLTSGGKEAPRMDYGRLPLGVPILLERPIRTATLVSTVRAAVRSRKRQYEIRDALRERDGALAELKQERETLQVMLDNLPVGVLLAKPSGEIVLGNRSLEAIVRHPLLETADIESHGRWVAFHPDGRRVSGEEYPLPRAMMQGRVIPPEDYLYERGDGTLAWLSIAAAPIFNDDGVVTGGVVAISDIDRQKRADGELRRSEERFRRLIENASVGVLIGTEQGTISYANPTLLKLLGYTAEEVERGEVRWDDITPPKFAEVDQTALEQLRTRGVADPYQKEFRAKDGRLIPLLLGATVIPSQKDSRGLSEVAVFLTDMTTQKLAEAALVQSEKLAAVGRLAASISHEINNPLEAVTNLLYLARHTGELPEAVRTLLDLADQELRRVSQIASQTLRFHRQSTRPRAVKPEELIDTALALYHGRLGNSNIELRLDHRGADAVTCYEGDIRQVLNNLIGNAVDAMRTGGRLTVRTSNARMWKAGVPGVRITIADTGGGMPAEVLCRIFEPFYTTKGINGTGLGLWISQGIIEKHRGRMQVQSSSQLPRTGTVFSLLLPREPLFSIEASERSR
ncbi:PAS domain-containing sensor histidine kinase [Granulicella sibirica]|uniref:histidine kinase n=1 Tax=Granulicella sibirica TaxID=2479048 RepID=A0A4Q0T588_9BACT|nr:PAS domain S-box protein [Granulicella sibirica]RXH57228.1 histidine kinase [Granulicella sibirica]